MKYQPRSVILLYLLLFIASLSTDAQTILVTDTIINNTTWSADTVKVMGDVTIAKDIILSIEPGTHVEFQGHYKIVVLGTINAVGSLEQPIRFTIDDTTGFSNIETKLGGWNGIRFQETTFSSYDTEFRHCIFEYGKATDGDAGTEVQEDHGGAIYIYQCYEEVVIDSCIFKNCQAQWNGGAICLRSGYSTLIQNCTLVDNQSYNGGAIYSSQSYDLNIIGNNISNNNAEYGGAILLSTSEGYFLNNVISNNESEYWGGAIYARQGWDILLVNNTIVNNLGGRGGGFYSFENIYPHRLVNNIFWGNVAEKDSQIYVNTQTIGIEYCNIQNGQSGDSNLDQEPLFVLPSSSPGNLLAGAETNWSLQSISPCINAGSPDYTLDSVAVSVDIAGMPRIQNDVIDMGAYEVSPDYNMAVRFKKEGGIVIVPHSNELSPAQITIECWIKKDTTLGYEYTLLDKRGNLGGYNLRLAGEHFPLSLHFILETNNGEVGTGSAEIFEHSTWNHVAATYDGSVMRMLVNGILVDSFQVTTDISLSQSPLHIGDFLGYPGSSINFGGDMDELRIWNYARTINEIADHMHDTLSADEPGLVGYWRFNEYSGTIAPDQTNNGNDGVLGPEACFVRSYAPIGYTPPMPPSGFRATGSDQSIDLRWTHLGENPDQINIYRGATKEFTLDPASLLAQVQSPDSIYIDLDVVQGEWYFYRLTSMDPQFHESTPGKMAVSRTVSTTEEFNTGVYYYPWYKDEPAFWTDYIRNYTIPRQPPLLDHYASNDDSVVQKHLEWMEAYGIDFIVSSWGGEEFAEDTVLKEVILPQIINTPLEFSIYYESAKLADENFNIVIDPTSEAELLDDILYLADNYFDHPNYLRVGNKPVIFIYLTGIYQGDYLGAFQRIRNSLMNMGHDLFIVGDEGSWGEFSQEHTQFLDAISPYIVLHQPFHGEYALDGNFFADYSMLVHAMEEITQSQNSMVIPNVHPGFNKNTFGGYYEFPRQIAPWANMTSLLEENIKAMRPFVDPQQRMIMITSWNEWYEDTQIEPTIQTAATSEDSSPSGNRYTGGHLYEGDGFDCLEVVDDLLSDGVSNVSNKNTNPENLTNTNAIFPNPSKHYFIINAPLNRTITSVELYASTGVLMDSFRVDNNSFTFYTDGLSPGIYFVKINEIFSSTVEKVIIE